MRVVEAAIARTWQTLGKPEEEPLPHLIGLESPNLHAGDRLDVSGHALGEPGVVFLERGMREMNHLVSHHPIAREIFGGSIAADGEANERVSVGRVTLADLAGSAGQDLYLGLAHREAAVVRGDGAPCRGDPSD